jgi:glycosyltransferase involved in cell wall biosynthesis
LKASLIITTYNNPVALKKVIDSVLCQTRLPDEVFIADDGSDKDTFHIVENFSKIAPFTIIHIWQEDKGFRAAKIRNEAIKQTTGDYIILLDGDCVINSNFISDHLLLAEKGYFIQGKRVLIDKGAEAVFNHEHANSSLTLIKMALTGKISNIHHLIRLPFSPSIKNRNLKGIKSCNLSFFKPDILAVNGFNEDFVGWGNEDSDLACRFFKYGLIKKVHPFMAVCFHLWHPSNKFVSDRNKQLLLATLASKEYYCKNGIFKKN